MKRKHNTGEIINGFKFLGYGPIVGKGNFECPFCSRVFSAYIGNIKRENIVGCGCQKYKDINVKHGEATSGNRQTAEYLSWARMKGRCYNVNDEKYKHYGARGIIVCDRWLNSYENFIEDMGRKPKGYSLERVNNDGIYEPGNCVWADRKTQVRNRRLTKYVTYKGQAKPLSQWCEELGLAYWTAYRRIFYNGLTPEQAFTLPKMPGISFSSRQPLAKSNFINHSFGHINTIQ